MLPVVDRNALNGPADGQDTFFEVDVLPPEPADLTDTKSHCERKRYTERESALVSVQIGFQLFLLVRIKQGDFSLRAFRHDDIREWTDDPVLSLSVFEGRFQQDHYVRNVAWGQPAVELFLHENVCVL